LGIGGVNRDTMCGQGDECVESVKGIGLKLRHRVQ
jgi:hypothetical protein